MQRVWHANGLKPHLLKTFKLSNDPDFIEKLEDVVGLYMNPPDHALVFCIDEKSQVQALDRTQPGLPMKKGRVGTMTHDYKRNGTTSLFAALDILKRRGGHRALQAATSPSGVSQVSLKPSTAALPNLSTSTALPTTTQPTKNRRSTTGSFRHPRFHRHFIPTSSSWLNLVERWFRKDHHRADPPRGFYQRVATRTCHLRLHRTQQCPPEAFRLDKIRERHHP